MCNKSLRAFATDRNFNSRRWFESTHAEMRSYHPRNSLHWELQDADRHLFKFHHLVHILVVSALLYFYLFIGTAFMLCFASFMLNVMLRSNFWHQISANPFILFDLLLFKLFDIFLSFYLLFSFSRHIYNWFKKETFIYSTILILILSVLKIVTDLIIYKYCKLLFHTYFIYFIYN